MTNLKKTIIDSGITKQKDIKLVIQINATYNYDVNLLLLKIKFCTLIKMSIF